MPKIETKATAAIQPGADDSDSDTGSFDIILSAQTRDRDGDVFKASEWKTPLPEWIPIDVDHAMSVEKTVGSGHPYINENGDLQVHGTYASTPLAQQTRALVNEGHVRYVSVAVMTDKSLKDGTPNRELLNGAFVNTPSNREAVVLASKGLYTHAEVQPLGDTAAKADDSKPKPPYGKVAYADPGYLDRDGKPADDGKGMPRYPIDTEEHARAAWSYINQERNASQYTPAQLSAIKDKIKAALTKFGVKISEDDDKDAKAWRAVSDLVEKGWDPAEAFAMITTKAGARNSGSDQKMIQAIHDASSLLGADCVSEADPDEDDGADEGANKGFTLNADGSMTWNGSIDFATRTASITTAAAPGVSNLPPILDAADTDAIDAFKQALAALTKTSGSVSPEPSDPAEPPAAPSGPAAGEAAEEDEEALELRARTMRLQMLAFDAQHAPIPS
jgi:hypothetical protein